MANVDTNSDQYKNSFNNMTVSSKYWQGVTDRGTKIITSKSNVNQDTFIKILCAELQHQDPTKQQDSAQAVSQLAQFAQLEQLQGVNTAINKNSYYALLGKAVAVSDTDTLGKQYAGIVQGLTVNKDGTATITMIVNENGQNVEKNFDSSHILHVVEPDDASTKPLTSLDLNMAFLMCSSFTGKDVKIEETGTDGKTKTYQGTVVGAVFENGVPKVNVKLEGSDEIKKFDYTTITQVQDKKYNATDDTKTETTTK